MEKFKIIDVRILPMVVSKSKLMLEVKPLNMQKHLFTEKVWKENSIEQLVKEFGFEAENDVYDFKSLKGKKCVIEFDYKFQITDFKFN